MRIHHNHVSGERHGRAKLDIGTAKKIRIEYAIGNITQRVLAEKYHVSTDTINKIINNKRWTS